MTAGPFPNDTRHVLRDRYTAVRDQSLALSAGLSAEDQCVQSMADASPTKWHLAHTTWFFETLVLLPYAAGYRPFDPHFARLFNSYYESLGVRHPRSQRGLLTRPSADDVRCYRLHIDGALRDFIDICPDDIWATVAGVIELGLQHEQQHQELLLTDIKHAFSLNPLLPAWRPTPKPTTPLDAGPSRWIEFPGGEVSIGHTGASFAFDNETPPHPALLQPYALAERLVTCGDYRAFIEDGGYRRPELWLSDGWATVQTQGWRAPLYWQVEDSAAPRLFTLSGLRDVDPAEPICHLSFYEAAAYAEWAGERLPTEFEWEAAAMTSKDLQQLFGAVWQWTRSSYDPYPGFRPLPGPASEYNGKFMVGQLVLRGSSCATPVGHSRITYRNFFPPSARWQFTGLRLARNL